MNQAPTTAVEMTLRATTPWPPALLVIAAVLSIALVCWLYWHERGKSGPRLRLALVACRCTILLATIWILQGWSMERFETSQPELILLLDRSSSMDTADQTDASEGETRADLIVSGLHSLPVRQRALVQSQYRSVWYQVADGLESFQEDWTSLNGLSSRVIAKTDQSRLGDALRRAIQRHGRGGGAAAIVLLSDGINTSGSVLLDAARDARAAAVPVHTVVVGRETAVPDVRIVDVLLEREIFLGDTAVVDVSLAASDTQLSSIQVKLLDAETGNLLDQRSSGLNDGQANLQLQFLPALLGAHNVTVEATGLPGEQDLTNNKASVSINVQDRTIRVLLVFERPSYEFRFLKNFLERSQRGNSGASFEVDCVLQDSDADYVLQDPTAIRLVPTDEETLSQYDAFIFGDCQPELISRSAQNTIRDNVLSRGSGCVFILGRGEPTYTWIGWPLADLWPFRITDVPSAANMDFPDSQTQSDSLYRWQPTDLGSSLLPPEFDGYQGASTWAKMPSFHSVATTRSIQPGAQVLATAVSEQGEFPLLVSQFAGAGRSIAQLTDETYLWTSVQGKDDGYQQYWSRILRWVTRGRLAKDGTSELRVLPRRARFGEAIRFSLLTQGQSGPSTARLWIEDADGQRQTVDLSRSTKSANVFQSTISNLSPGEYQAIWTSESPSVTLREQFTVSAPPSEQANLTADHEVMRQVAEISRGKFYEQSDMSELLENLPPGRRVRLGTLPPTPLWNHPLVALGLLSLLTVEWLLRRRGRML